MISHIKQVYFNQLFKIAFFGFIRLFNRDFMAPCDKHKKGIRMLTNYLKEKRAFMVPALKNSKLNIVIKSINKNDK